MRAADFILNEILPPDIRQPTYDLTAKGVDRLMAAVARAHPDKYATIAKQIGDLGRNAAWHSGFTVRPSDLDPVIDVNQYMKRMDAEIASINKERGLSDTERKKLREETMLRYSTLIGADTAKTAYANGNAIARATQSGARGNAGHLQAILSTPGVYMDSKDNVIPLFVRNSFARGVRPAETLAGTYGGRKAVVATKVSTAQGGFFSKMLAQIASRYNITTHDCGVENGIDLPADDPSLRGRVLARPTGGYDAGTVIDRHVLASLRKSDKPIVVRSPMTCGARHGLCAKCFGLEPDGRFPKVGASIGEKAANSVGEPQTQAALNCVVEGTLVRMADYSVKRIEDVKVGDFVLGADMHGNTFPVKVLAVHDQGMQPVQKYTYRLGGTKQHISIECTAIHELLSKQGETLVKVLAHDAEVVVLSAAQATQPDQYIAKRVATDYSGVKPCWDLSVDHPDELFVLHNSLIIKNTKHNSGQAKGGKNAFSGFSYISQFVQIPTEFKDRAAVSEVDGTVEGIHDAPQGGKYINVEGKQHFVLPGFATNVKVGERVEAGHILSDGLASPADIVKLRGLGEGRRYFADRLEKILKDSGQPPNRRRLEVLARAAVDNYRVTESDDSHDWLPDDEITEADLNAHYVKPAGTVRTKASNAVGKYLQAPALHYTIGTRITPSAAKRLDAADYEVDVADTKPNAEPEMRRLQTATHNSGDWLSDMSTSYVKAQLRDSLERGADTNIESNYHYAPRLAFGVDFGKNIEQTGKF